MPSYRFPGWAAGLSASLIKLVLHYSRNLIYHIRGHKNVFLSRSRSPPHPYLSHPFVYWGAFSVATLALIVLLLVLFIFIYLLKEASREWMFSVKFAQEIAAQSCMLTKKIEFGWSARFQRYVTNLALCLIMSVNRHCHSLTLRLGSTISD